MLIAAAVAALVVRIHLRMPAHMAAKATGESDKIFIYGSAVYALLRLMKYKTRDLVSPALRAPAGPAKGPACAGAAPVAHHGDEPLQPRGARPRRKRPRQGHLYPALQAAEPVRKLRFMFAAAFGKGVYTGLDTPLVHEEPKPQYDYTFAVAQKKGLKARKKKVKPVRLNKRPKPAGAPKRPSAPAPETTPGRLPRSPTLRGSPTNAPDQPPVAPARREGERETGAHPEAAFRPPELIETHTGCDSRQGGGMP